MGSTNGLIWSPVVSPIISRSLNWFSCRRQWNQLTSRNAELKQ